MKEESKKAIIYMRCSTDEDRQNVENQLKKCVDMARSIGAKYLIVREYSSAWNKKRPKFEKCLTLLDKFDIWISYNLDRFSRDNPHIANEKLNYIVHKKGLRFLSLTDNIDSDDEVKWNIVRHFMVYYANKYSEMLSIRIKEAFEYKRKHDPNFKIGRKRSCDYDEIRKLFKKGKGRKISQIARDLNVNKSSVWNAVKNERDEVEE